jgi:hypothetical protein
METYTPEYLSRWKLPRDYAGAEWPDYFNAGGRHRDSDCLEESNFAAIVRAVGGESDTVRIVRESHWAVGWVEWLAIHNSDAAALRAADDCRRRLESYPVLDEGDFSRREDEECAAVWESCYRPRERAEYFRRHGHGGGFRELMAAVRGDWFAAASVLHCPSDLLS